jgi:chitin synthase
MAQARPPLPSLSRQGSQEEFDHNVINPFADRPRAINFQEPASDYASTVSLPQEFDQGNDESEEKLPLTKDFGGGFYPPG